MKKDNYFVPQSDMIDVEIAMNVFSPGGDVSEKLSNPFAKGSVLKRLLLTVSAAAIIILPSCKKGDVKVEVESIALDKTEITLEKGKKEVLSVTFTPSNATDKSLEWISTDTDVATVDAGIISAIAPGHTDIVAKSGSIVARCAVEVIVQVKGISLSKNELTLCRGEEEKLVATLDPDDATDAVEWSSSDNTVATVLDGKVTAVGVGSATITAKVASFEKECALTVNPPRGSVDLGIVVTRKDETTYTLYWAESNLSDEGLCSKPEDFGDYYAWGETEPKSEYFDNKWYDSETSQWTKYNYSGDGKLTLDPEDDAAHVILGGGWHIPTLEEMKTIVKQCTAVWKSRNGVSGYEITGPNGNSIFLPAAGYHSGDKYYNTYSIYWTSDIHYGFFERTASFTLTFKSEYFDTNYIHRNFGCTIRPVTE